MGGDAIGRIKIGLFGGIVPRTCENIAQLAAQTEVSCLNIRRFNHLLSVTAAWEWLQEVHISQSAEGLHGAGRGFYQRRWHWRLLNLWSNF